MSQPGWVRKHNRNAEAIRRANEMTDGLHAWATARRGWKFHEPTEGSWTAWASRTFEYPRLHPWTRLTVRFSPARAADRPPRLNDWLGELLVAVSAGPEDQRQGTFEDIEHWIRDREKMLALPLHLSECKTVHEATHIVQQAPRPHVGMLGFLFDIASDDVTGIRQRLVSDFLPRGTQVAVPVNALFP
ncbi:hypothetical protein AB0M02_00530 [Actinoplanes sp. NPDC051861]|uniref:hypothetical protein n=1 Tax=Actinoplanes sp. NPDC051861 TaxID=3155170 RepID=UPI00343DDB0F